VLVTNEVIGRQKLKRLMALANSARIGVCVDDVGQVRALSGKHGVNPITGSLTSALARLLEFFGPIWKFLGRSRRAPFR
jgi:hypothetical protein